MTISYHRSREAQSKKNYELNSIILGNSLCDHYQSRYTIVVMLRHRHPHIIMPKLN